MTGSNWNEADHPRDNDGKFTKRKPVREVLLIEKALKHYESDQKANVYGRAQGLKNPNIDCKILVDKYRPKGLGKRY